MGILTYNKSKHQTSQGFRLSFLKLCIEQKSHGWVHATLYRETLAFIRGLFQTFASLSCGHLDAQGSGITLSR